MAHPPGLMIVTKEQHQIPDWRQAGFNKKLKIFLYIIDLLGSTIQEYGSKSTTIRLFGVRFTLRETTHLQT
jgi:hypothetical protein